MANYKSHTTAISGAYVGTLTIGKPSGVVEGDFLLYSIGAVGAGPTYVVAGPDESWTHAYGVSYQGKRNTILWKFATSSEPASYDFTFTGGTMRFCSAMFRFNAMDPNNPINASATETNSAGGIIIPSVTSTVDNCILLGFGNHGYPGTETTEPNDIDPGWFILETASNKYVAGWKTQETAGASGTSAWSFSSTPQYRIGTHIALAPLTDKPIANLPVTSVDFGKAYNGGESPTAEITVQNTGTQELILSEPTVSDGFSSATTYPVSVAAKSETKVKVKRDKEIKGNKNGQIDIPTNDLDAPVITILLSGEILETSSIHPSILFEVNLWPVDEMPLNVVERVPTDESQKNQRTIQIAGHNGYLKHGDQFTLYGAQALKIKATLSTGVLDDRLSKPLIVLT